MTTYKTKAAFLVGSKWTWRTWTSNHASKHAAIVAMRDELGAQGYDCGNADHEEVSRWQPSR